jgi:hypothetical protein
MREGWRGEERGEMEGEKDGEEGRGGAYLSVASTAWSAFCSSSRPFSVIGRSIVSLVIIALYTTQNRSNIILHFMLNMVLTTTFYFILQNKKCVLVQLENIINMRQLALYTQVFIQQ